MSKEQLITHPTDFATIYTTLFSLSVSVEATQALQGLLSEKGYKHANNKVKEAERACTAAYAQIERAMTRKLDPEQKTILLEAVEVQKNILYDFFLLESDQQELVRDFIKNIKQLF